MSHFCVVVVGVLEAGVGAGLEAHEAAYVFVAGLNNTLSQQIRVGKDADQTCNFICFSIN